MNTNNLWNEEGDGLAEHAGFSFNATNTPANDSKAIDHGGVRVCADEGIWIVGAFFFKHALGEVF